MSELSAAHENLPDPEIHAAFNELLIARNSAGTCGDAWVSAQQPGGDALYALLEGAYKIKGGDLLPRKAIGIAMEYDDEAQSEVLRLSVNKRKLTESGHQLLTMTLSLTRNLPLDQQGPVTYSLSEHPKLFGSATEEDVLEVTAERELTSELLAEFTATAQEPLSNDFAELSPQPEHVQRPGTWRRFAGSLALRRR
jgi:hypothetical protein